MNKKQLKTMIREMVKESLLEIFAEMKLETIVEHEVRKQKELNIIPERTNKINKVTQSSQPSRAELKQTLKEAIGISDDLYSDIYSDTVGSENPLLNGTENEKPELVSEDTLRQCGLMKDYSRFVE